MISLLNWWFVTTVVFDLIEKRPFCRLANSIVVYITVTRLSACNAQEWEK